MRLLHNTNVIVAVVSRDVGRHALNNGLVLLTRRRTVYVLTGSSLVT